ncbi:MAG: polysaccharide deacetylase family protein [Bacteroidaceae bacterium]|nr:polysaccharide deacetylase family protein [Bacteroidaceae bacterium]
MLIEQPNILLKKIYPSALWRMNPEEKAIYLTFDDGPIPEVTPWVLDKLDQFGAKATFFMVGDNVRKHPDIFRMVVERGHGFGNHTMHHIKFFDRNSLRYMDDVREADKVFIDNLPHSPLNIDHLLLTIEQPSKGQSSIVNGQSPMVNGQSSIVNGQCRLFRPPHGFMNHYQYKKLQWAGYKIVMWDLVTRDYSNKLTPPQVLSNVLRYTRNGSIITFHDSLKSWNGGNLQYALSHALWFLKEEGYQFKLL